MAPGRTVKPFIKAYSSRDFASIQNLYMDLSIQSLATILIPYIGWIQVFRDLRACSSEK